MTQNWKDMSLVGFNSGTARKITFSNKCASSFRKANHGIASSSAIWRSNIELADVTLSLPPRRLIYPADGIGNNTKIIFLSGVCWKFTKIVSLQLIH